MLACCLWANVGTASLTLPQGSKITLIQPLKFKNFHVMICSA